MVSITIDVDCSCRFQHFVFGFHGHELTDDVKALIRDYHVGSIILMKRNVRGKLWTFI